IQARPRHPGCTRLLMFPHMISLLGRPSTVIDSGPNPVNSSSQVAPVPKGTPAHSSTQTLIRTTIVNQNFQHPKPWSNKTEKMRKGYFPVSWRVIGGGVRLSNGTGAPSQLYFHNARVVADGQAGPVSHETEISHSAPPTTVAFLTPTMQPPLRQHKRRLS
ncbi:hypothetical protein B0H14DRAFT_2700115, partial [Mycena olivaceomarginata]